MLAAYAFAVRIIVQSKGLKSWVPSDGRREEESRASSAAATTSLASLIRRTVAAAAAILAAGFLLARSGAAIAEQTGLGTNFFGVVLLAAATSLPEVSTVIATVRMRRYEMAIADVFGTNLFNMMIIVLVDALHPGKPVLVEVGPFAAFAALLAAILSLLFLVGMIERRNRTFLRMGIDSIVALVAYGAGIVVLYQLR
jgi:cation:H+ antiporter